MLRRLLRPAFPGVGRRRVGTLMRHMGMAAVCPQPGTSRRRRRHPILAGRVSITLDSAFCIAAVEEALARYGRPAIFTTDHRAQFTSAAFTGLLHDHRIQISMDGKGCWRNDIFVERLWRSLKYEEVYLHDYSSVSAATAGIGRYFTR